LRNPSNILVVKKHEAPQNTQMPEKAVGRHQINEDESKAPAMGVPENED
jgi:hypothetical protein